MSRQRVYRLTVRRLRCIQMITQRRYIRLSVLRQTCSPFIPAPSPLPHTRDGARNRPAAKLRVATSSRRVVSGTLVLTQASERDIHHAYRRLILRSMQAGDTSDVPTALAMAGGYAREIGDTVSIHANTVRLARRIWS